MPDMQEDRFKEAATLTRAIENVFRKLIRFLVGRISLVKLQEMLNYIYVEESEARLKSSYPGKGVPLTKLALATGLDTRTVAKIKKVIEKSGPLYRQQFLKDLTPESAVVEAWASRVARTPSDQKSHARVLTYGDADSGFEKLLRATITSRGITTQSVLERLTATKSAIQHKENRTVELLVEKYAPYLSSDEQNIVNAALSAVANLISTVEHNIGVSASEKLFQRQVWTFRLPTERKFEFRAMLRKFLEETERAASIVMEPWESEAYGDEVLSAGLGLYYFEELATKASP